MSKEKPAFSRPSGWKLSGKNFYSYASAGGMKFMCKHCGKKTLGYRSPAESHMKNCRVMADERRAGFSVETPSADTSTCHADCVQAIGFDEAGTFTEADLSAARSRIRRTVSSGLSASDGQVALSEGGKETLKWVKGIKANPGPQAEFINSTVGEVLLGGGQPSGAKSKPVSLGLISSTGQRPVFEKIDIEAIAKRQERKDRDIAFLEERGDRDALSYIDRETNRDRGALLTLTNTLKAALTECIRIARDSDYSMYTEEKIAAWEEML